MKEDSFQKGSHFLTRELIIASVLSYFSHLIERVEWDGRGEIAYFIIPFEKNTKKVLEDYHKGKLRVEPREFNNRMRELKRRVFENKKQERY